MPEKVQVHRAGDVFQEYPESPRSIPEKEMIKRRLKGDQLQPALLLPM